MNPTRLLARTTRGVESLAAQEIRALGEVRRIGHREVWWTCAAPGPEVLGLRCADDVFLVAGVVTGIGRARADLRRLASFAGSDVGRSVARRRLFGVPDPPSTMDVSASFLGRRNYSRYDLEDAVGGPLSAVLGLPYVSRRDGVPPPGLSWRLTVAGDRAVLCLRIGSKPLHRRDYRRESRPGAVHPPVAAAMLRLAQPRPGERLLDPFCGTGTIPIEAVPTGVLAIGTDAEPAAVAAATANLAGYAPPVAMAADPVTGRNGTSPAVGDPADFAGHGLPPGNPFAAAADRRAETPPSGDGPDHRVSWAVADAGRLPFPAGAFDLVVTNPPWDRQVPPTGVLATRPDRFWHELRRVLAPTGRAVVLLPDADRHLRAAAGAGLHPSARHPVSLSGTHPEIVTLRPAPTRR